MRSASSSRSIIPTPTSRRSRRCSGGRPIRRSAPRSRAAAACPTARGRSTRAGTRPFPKLVFPGGALIGCSAGFVNVPRIKGTHTAMKSAMLAAEAAFEAITENWSGDMLEGYPEALHGSWVAKELNGVRNAQPAVAHWGSDFRNTLRWARHVVQSARNWRALDAEAQGRQHCRSSARKRRGRSIIQSLTASSPSTDSPRCSSPTPITRKTSRFI